LTEIIEEGILVQEKTDAEKLMRNNEKCNIYLYFIMPRFG
jgi:hypothetical protein